MSKLPPSTLWTEEPLFDMPREEIAPSDAVLVVWNYWIELMRTNSKGRMVLSDKRRRKIENGLKNYGVEDCLDAIRGCHANDFFMGRNGRGTKYDDIELILRDPEHIERFRDEWRNRKNKNDRTDF